MSENNQRNRILIVHLSDIHIKDSSRTPANKIDELVKLVSNFGTFNKVFLAFTGDLAYSGKKKRVHRI